jgi:hypothetical protein
MSESYSIIKQGSARKWVLEFTNAALSKREGVYIQRGPGNPVCIIGYCPNMGHPFDAASHRGSRAVFEHFDQMHRRPVSKRFAVQSAKKVWHDTK